MPDASAPKERPGTKTLDYIALGLLLAPPAVVFEMYVKGDSINWLRTAVATPICWAVGALVVLASHRWQSRQSINWRMWPYLVAAERRFWGKALIVAVAIGGALILSSVLSSKPSAPAGFTQQQVDAKIAAATAPIQAKLSAAITEIDHLKSQSQSAALKLGPLESLKIAKYIRNTPDHWAMFITYPPDNQDFYGVLLGLLRDQINPWVLNAPDNSTDLDAPKFPPPPNEPGLIFHGENALNTQLSSILSQCFIVRRTDREISGLAEWFNKRLSDPERAENRKITWLEIGHGSPWLQGNRLSPDCFK